MSANKDGSHKCDIADFSAQALYLTALHSRASINVPITSAASALTPRSTAKQPPPLLSTLLYFSLIYCISATGTISRCCAPNAFAFPLFSSYYLHYYHNVGVSRTEAADCTRGELGGVCGDSSRRGNKCALSISIILIMRAEILMRGRGAVSLFGVCAAVVGTLESVCYRDKSDCEPFPPRVLQREMGLIRCRGLLETLVRARGTQCCVQHADEM